MAELQDIGAEGTASRGHNGGGRDGWESGGGCGGREGRGEKEGGACNRWEGGGWLQEQEEAEVNV